MILQKMTDTDDSKFYKDDIVYLSNSFIPAANHLPCAYLEFKGFSTVS